MRTATFLLCCSALTLAASAQTTETNVHKRKVLLEVFSTERCTNCPAGHQTIANVIGDTPDIIEITHHAGFFTDYFTIPESVEYEWFYKSPDYNTTFAPGFMTDRTAWTHLDDYYYYGTPVAMSFSSKSLKAACAEAVKEPAYADIRITPQYDPASRVLDIEIEAETLVTDEAYSHPTLNVFLVEDDVLALHQEGVFGKYYHRHLVRQCLTTTWGEGFEAGGTIARNYSVTLPEMWNAEKVSIVAFVANYNASNNADCRVMNAEEVGLQPFLDGIGTIEQDATSSHKPLYDLYGRTCPELPSKGICIDPNSETHKLYVK